MRTERLTILVSPDEKASMVAMAQSLGMTTSDMLRFAFASMNPVQANMVEGLTREVERSIDLARKAVADAHREVLETMKVTRGERVEAA